VILNVFIIALAVQTCTRRTRSIWIRRRAHATPKPSFKSLACSHKPSS
jgi:hypothetical protein